MVLQRLPNVLPRAVRVRKTHSECGAAGEMPRMQQEYPIQVGLHAEALL